MSDTAVADFATWSVACAARTEAALGALLPPASELPAVLHEGMRYATLGGGKRVRPLLVHAAGLRVGADPAVLDALACAVECIHAYSLVHDDLPCMDNDVLRRGKPTVHVAFGEAQALLVGDALQALAFESLGEALRAPALATCGAELTLALARAAGSRGMAGGQSIDLASVGVALTREQLEAMHRRKTGALLSVSAWLGAWGAGRPSDAELAALDTYSAAIGLAFQVVDDILDVEADASVLGKTPGKDQAQDKPTYVALIGLEPARALAGRLLTEALAALAGLNGDTRRLAELARYIVLRKA